MNIQTTFEPQPKRRSNRAPLLALLVCSLFWSVITFGCATVTFVTDVIYNENGNGAVVTMGIEYDRGVYNALQNIDSTMTTNVTARQAASGWTPTIRAGGLKTILRHSYDTLDDLKGVPMLIAGEGGKATDSFIQEVSVTTREVGDLDVEYTFEAKVVIPAREESASELGLDDYPDLVAAMDKAGAAKIVVQTYLPGTVDPDTMDATIGEVDGGHVIWHFSEDRPGTYQLRASSYGPNPREARAQFADMFGSRERIEEFDSAADVLQPQREIAKLEAIEFLGDYRVKAGSDMNSKTATPKEALLAETAYFASFCKDEGGKKVCLMPNLYRALALIQKIALRTGDDLDSIAALAELVAQLYQADLEALKATK